MDKHPDAMRILPWALFGLIVACGGGGKAAGDGATACVPGELGCDCYPNATCNLPYTCSPAMLCVAAAPLDGALVIPTGGTDDGAVPFAPDGAPGTGGIIAVPDGGQGGGPITDAPQAAGGADGGGKIDAPADSGGGPLDVHPGTGGSMRLDTGVPPVDAGPCAEPELNCPCATLGALNCVGHAQKGMMMCDGTKWVPNGACAGALLCDTMPGPSQGTCVQPIANCANQTPGYSYCSGTSNKVTCGPDLLTVTGESCPFVCTAGQCTGECTPSARDCDGPTPLSCATNATWLRGTTCTTDCNKGSCCGTSTPNVCNGACVNLQTNNANCGGCGIACVTTGGKSCQAGVCQCAAGMTDCAGTCVSLSTSSANCGQCGKLCEGGRTCQASLCACPAGTKECNGACINVQTDPANCGACGQSCGASTCYGGTCGGENLILNGDFTDGGTYWTVTQTTSGVSAGTAAGGYCVSLPAYGEATLGWPDPLNPSLAVPIASGYGYTLSYTVSSTVALYSLVAKIGHAVSPYTSVYSTSLDKPGATATAFTHSFTASRTDTGAGIAFSLEANGATTVCFDDVSLVRH